MAPMAVQKSHSLKRTSSIAQFDEPTAKKLNRGLVRHHKPAWDLQREQRLNALICDDTDVQLMLTRSIGLALEAVGFEAATPEAIDTFRGDVEEYMAHYLADVRQSMLSCRRIQPIPQDFLQALHTHQLSLRSLLPHLDPPVPPDRSQYPLQSEPPEKDENQHLRFLGSILSDAETEQAKTYVPKHFPELPSKHTYRATAQFPSRDVDPRKVRERATQEGRLGEEALRRLVASSTGHSTQEPQRKPGSVIGRAKRDQMFRETMAAISEGISDPMEIDSGMDAIGKGKQKEGDIAGLASFRSGRLHSAVNSEKKYWRKPIPRRTGND
ncbi:hypothetical protein ACLMJK_000615 [Lecanora helva]